MLSNPNVKQIMPKVGNRYECALAIAKRARDIEKRRTMENSSDIKDAVDIASKEIANEDVYVKINGKYVVKKDDTEGQKNDYQEAIKDISKRVIKE